MALIVKLGLPPARALNIDDYEPSFAAYMRAAWGDGINDNAGTVTGNMLEASERRYGFNVMDAAEAGGLTGGLEGLREAEPLAPWGMEEQKAYIKREGLEGLLAPGEHYTREELEFLARLKHEEIDRKLTREKAAAWMAPFGFLAELGASFTDPINLAMSLVPVLPEARMMRLMAKAKGAWGRAGIRTGAGAAEGAIGAAALEPLILGGKTELQQEYDLADSLMNVVFGASMGAVMKPAAGAAGDWMRRKRGRRQPWEYAPSSDLTERLRSENAARIWEGMKASGSEKLSPEHAEAAAALWDATLRGYAYDTGELVGDLYKRYRTEYRGGKLEIADMQGDAWEQAMQRSTADNKLNFIKDVRAGKIEYFVGEVEPTAIKEFFGIDDLVVNYPYYFIQHLDNRRRDATYALLDKADDVLANADYIKKTGKRKTGEILYSAVRRNEDGTATLLVFELSKSRKKGNRILPHSAITEKQNAIENVVNQKERASTSTNTGGSPGVMPKPQKEDELRVLEALKDAEGTAPVKRIRQFATEGKPRARVSFGEADAYALVEFFKSADPSTAPHEMYHIFRRIMADMYNDPNASEASRERYRKACEFVGAEPGKAWTRAQEEMFARAGERFLLEGISPNPRMDDVMESFRQWMEEVYGNAERSGLEISDGMRELFGGMMGTAEDGDISFRYAMGKLLDYSPEKDIDTRAELPDADAEDITGAAMLEAHAREAEARLNEAFNALADRPDARERFRADLEADMAEADAAVMEAQRRGDIMREAAACITRS